MAAVNYGYFYVDAQDSSHTSARKLATTTTANWNAGNYNWNGSGYINNITNWNWSTGTGTIPDSIYNYIFRHTEDWNSGKGPERYLGEFAIQIAIKDDFSYYRMRLIITNGNAYYYGYLKFGCVKNSEAAPAAASNLPYGGTTNYNVQGKTNGTVVAESGNIATGFSTGSATKLRLYAYCHQNACYSLGTSSLSAAPVAVSEIYIKKSYTPPSGLSASITQVTGKTLTAKAAWTHGVGDYTSSEKVIVTLYSDSARTKQVGSAKTISTSGSTVTFTGLTQGTTYYAKYVLKDNYTPSAATNTSRYAKTYNLKLDLISKDTGSVIIKGTEQVGSINGTNQAAYGKYEAYNQLKVNTSGEEVVLTDVRWWLPMLGGLVNSATQTEISLLYLGGASFLTIEPGGKYKVCASVFDPNNTQTYTYSGGTTTYYAITDIDAELAWSTNTIPEFQSIEIYNCTGTTVSLKVKYKDSDDTTDKVTIELQTDSSQRTATYSRTCNNGGVITTPEMIIYDLPNGTNFEVNGSITSKNYGVLPVRIYITGRTWGIEEITPTYITSRNLNAKLKLIKGTIHRDVNGNEVSVDDMWGQIYAQGTDTDYSLTSMETKFYDSTLESDTVALGDSNSGLANQGETLTLTAKITNTTMVNNSGVLDVIATNTDYNLRSLYMLFYESTVTQDSITIAYRIYLTDGPTFELTHLKDPIVNKSYKFTCTLVPVMECPYNTDEYYDEGYDVDTGNVRLSTGITNATQGSVKFMFTSLTPWSWYKYTIKVSDQVDSTKNTTIEEGFIHTDYPYIRIYKDGEWKKCMAFIHNGTKFKTAITNIHNGTSWKEIDGQ